MTNNLTELQPWMKVQLVLFYREWKPMYDNWVLKEPVHNSEWDIIDWIVEVWAATGRKSVDGTLYTWSKNRKLSAFTAMKVMEEEETTE